MGITHDTRWRPTVAVSILLWQGESLLMLYRAQPPILWGPPGGRVEAGEEPYAALHRELREETGLEQVNIVAPCIVEAGQHEGHEILFLDFVGWCLPPDPPIRLDPAEHSAWRWMALSRLRQARIQPAVAVGGEPYAIYRWGDDDEELHLSHTLEQLKHSRRILLALTPAE